MVKLARIGIVLMSLVFLVGCGTYSKSEYFFKIDQGFPIMVDAVAKESPFLLYCYGYDLPSFRGEMLGAYLDAKELVRDYYQDEMTRAQVNELSEKLGNIAVFKFAKANKDNFVDLDSLSEQQKTECIKMQQDSEIMSKM